MKQDGTPPKFSDLTTAIDLVLQGDHPTDEPGPFTLRHRQTPLTAAQSTQIPNEIIYNRAMYPTVVPAPTTDSKHPHATLRDMYTAPVSTDNNNQFDQDRKQFEGDLKAYYATHGAQVITLAPFMFAASAAIFAERQTIEAPLAGFTFPVETGAAAPAGTTYQNASVILSPKAGATPPQLLHRSSGVLLRTWLDVSIPAYTTTTI